MHILARIKLYIRRKRALYKAKRDTLNKVADALIAVNNPVQIPTSSAITPVLEPTEMEKSLQELNNAVSTPSPVNERDIKLDIINKRIGA